MQTRPAAEQREARKRTNNARQAKTEIHNNGEGGGREAEDTVRTDSQVETPKRETQTLAKEHRWLLFSRRCVDVCRSVLFLFPCVSFLL